MKTRCFISLQLNSSNNKPNYKNRKANYKNRKVGQYLAQSWQKMKLELHSSIGVNSEVLRRQNNLTEHSFYLT